ncbi:MAG: sugar ABC transporter permease [Bifidobacteriaceae bacterium]|jgi:arabinogalactan oligomer/maltooligosaccharide transport system permease protein|nr:sugar ABC transporter permease [Bifidobacteriaceae bacterium]
MVTGAPAPAAAKKRAPSKPKKASPDSVPKSPYTLGAAFTQGDIFTKGSALVMGLGNFARRQYVKGAIFLAGEALFIWLLISSGISSLAGLGNLAPVTEATQGWDADGNYINVNPTNSVRVLLFGVAWVGVIVLFAVFWRAAVKSAYQAQVLAAAKGRAPTLVEDLKSLVDNRIYASLMTLPTAGLLIFTVLPLVFMISMAFTSFDKNHPVAFNWVGLKNFATVLSSSGSQDLGVNVKLFASVLIWTLCWAFFATFLNFFFGMFMAMIILRVGTRFKGLWRACFSMSIAVPQFVSLLVINSMLQDQGIINQMLKGWGWIDTSLPFFTNAWWARATVIVVNLWIGIPYTIMQVTGILQNIPAETHEAAKIDGASWWQRYRYVTMPYILFVMTPYLITTFTANVNNFNVIYLLSGGAPTKVGDSAGSTDLLITWLYKLTVDKSNYNVGAVIGILTFIVLAVVSLITYRSSGSYKNEEGFR